MTSHMNMTPWPGETIEIKIYIYINKDTPHDRHSTRGIAPV